MAEALTEESRATFSRARIPKDAGASEIAAIPLHVALIRRWLLTRQRHAAQYAGSQILGHNL